MKRNLGILGTLGGAMLVANCALAQPPKTTDVLYQETFEGGAGGWTPMGDTAKVSLAQGAENVKEGKGALRFDYNIAAGQINLLGIPLAQQPFTALQSVTFWVKASHGSSFSFTLQEQGGGRFNAMFAVPKEKWQRVELRPTDFILAEDKNDPKDANGKLDLDKIEGGALVDFGQIFAQLAAGPNNPLAQLLNVQTGPRTLLVDDVVLSSKPFAGEAATPGVTVIDDFSRPQAAWFSVGDIGLQTVKDANPDNNALQADYWQEQGRIVALAKLLPRGILANKEGLSFKAASTQRGILVVQLEEHSGGKYNMTVEMPGKTQPIQSKLLFSDFKVADDSKDNNNRLDLDQVKQLLILDLTGVIGQANTPNTLWLNHILVK